MLLRRWEVNLMESTTSVPGASEGKATHSDGGSAGSTGGGGNSGGKKIFPEVLMEILSLAEQDPTVSEIITWLPAGNAFIIFEPEAFADIILPRYFPKSRYASFTRKLNRWGFRQITKGQERGAFQHDLFLRDKPHMCRHMSCNKNQGKAGMAAAGIVSSSPRLGMGGPGMHPGAMVFDPAALAGIGSGGMVGHLGPADPMAFGGLFGGPQDPFPQATPSGPMSRQFMPHCPAVGGMGGQGGPFDLDMMRQLQGMQQVPSSMGGNGPPLGGGTPIMGGQPGPGGAESSASKHGAGGTGGVGGHSQGNSSSAEMEAMMRGQFVGMQSLQGGPPNPAISGGGGGASSNGAAGAVGSGGGGYGHFPPMHGMPHIMQGQTNVNAGPHPMSGNDMHHHYQGSPAMHGSPGGGGPSSSQQQGGGGGMDGMFNPTPVGMPHNAAPQHHSHHPGAAMMGGNPALNSSDDLHRRMMALQQQQQQLAFSALTQGHKDLLSTGKASGVDAAHFAATRGGHGGLDIDHNSKDVSPKADANSPPTPSKTTNIAGRSA